MAVKLTTIPSNTPDDESRDFFEGQSVTLEVAVTSESDLGSGPYEFVWRFAPRRGLEIPPPSPAPNWTGYPRTLLQDPRPLGERQEGSTRVFVFAWNVEGDDPVVSGSDITLAVFVYEPSAGNITLTAKQRPTFPKAGTGNFDDTARTGVLDYSLRSASKPLEAVATAEALARSGGIPISLQRDAAPVGNRVDEGLWVRILATTRATSYPAYRDHLASRGLKLHQSGTKAYTDLKEATHLFLKDQCEREPLGLDEARAEAFTRLRRPFDGIISKSLPAAELVKERLPLPVDPVPGSTPRRVTVGREQLIIPRETFDYRQLCLVELIWSYWHEEAMLVQTIKAISRRFQNRAAPSPRDPLQAMEIDPLRPLSNLFWGYIQDEQYRISVLRRAHEYEHHYGISLHGSAVRGVRAADRRTKFLESFHNLLFRCLQFYRQDDDKTVSADGFPVLNAIKETHYLVQHGAHNQFGDLPETDREEKLIEMWLLGRPEMREFLRGRPMVPYPEEWMDRVDHMKSMQAWTDVSVVHFHDLAVFGEQLLLSIRWGSWATQSDPGTAVAWARFWRQEVQGYVHAYRAATGVDLSAEVTDERQLLIRNAPPSVHLSRRLAAQGAFRS